MPFAGKASFYRDNGSACVCPAGYKRDGRVFLGNGLSRTAMVYKIASMCGVKLSPAHLNKVKSVNPRSLEQVYDEVVRVGDKTNALFALRLILK